MKGKYDAIISLPHHVSGIHPPMPMLDRAAQFAPFAALVGYDAAVKETEMRCNSPEPEPGSREECLPDWWD